MTSILKADTIQDTDGNNIINENSNTITIGASGDIVNVIGTLQSNGTAVPTVAGGITVADQYRVTANLTANDVISSNIERVDTAGQGFIGTAMSESSGIFTFPSTGVYLVSMGGRGDTPNSADNTSLSIEVTTNNSSYNTAASCSDSGNSSNKNFGMYAQTLIDVTDVSNVKVRFSVGSLASGHFFSGSTDTNLTYMTFIRLGDT